MRSVARLESPRAYRVALVEHALRHTGEAECEGRYRASQRRASTLDRDQLRELLALRHGLLLDDANAAAVPLQLVLLVDRAVLEREQRPLEEAVRRTHGAAGAEHLGLVHGMPRRVLLPVYIAAVRVGEHDDAGLTVADAGLPGPVVLYPAPVLEVARVLPEVPDVPLLVLRVPVEGALLGLALREDPVQDHRRLDAHDALLAVRHLDRVELARPAVVADAPVAKDGPRLERQPGVVDRAAGVRRVKGRVVGRCN